MGSCGEGSDLGSGVAVSCTHSRDRARLQGVTCHRKRPAGGATGLSQTRRDATAGHGTGRQLVPPRRSRARVAATILGHGSQAPGPAEQIDGYASPAPGGRLSNDGQRRSVRTEAIPGRWSTSPQLSLWIADSVAYLLVVRPVGFRRAGAPCRHLKVEN